MLFYVACIVLCAPSPFTVDDYIVLSGQHLLEALRRRGADFVAEKLDVPRQYEYVLATILKPETPIDARQAVAGDAQAAQMAVRAITIPEFASLLLTCSAEPDKAKRLGKAWGKAGWDRTARLVCVCCLFVSFAEFLCYLSVCICDDMVQRLN